MEVIIKCMQRLRPNIHNPLRRLAGTGYLVFGILLAACLTPTPTVSPTPAAPAAGTPTPTSVLESTTPGPVSTPDAAGRVLRLWLPPQFAPAESTPAGKAMLAQLQAFEEAHGWRVEVQAKKVAGQGGLLDYLRTSLQVAPGVSPDVIALDAAMLRAATDSGTIHPLTGLTDSDLAGYYGFALESATVNSILMGLPFAADALGLAYSITAHPVPPQSWADFTPEQGSVWLALSDPAALTTLQQYAALGGQLTNESGELMLDSRLLAQVLGDYQAMQRNGLLPADSLGAPSAEMTWTAYRDNRATAAVALFSAYLTDRRRVSATAFSFVPSHTGRRATFARQWNYALVATDSTRQQAALDLIRWLTTPENLGAWTMAANVLPPESRALSAWSDTSLAAVADGFMSIAQPEPSQAALAVIGPSVTAAVQSVLNGQASPESAAAIAAAAVNGR